LQGVHSEHAANIDFAGTGKQFVAHHAHDRAGHDAEVFFNRSPALDGADRNFGRRHPLINDRPSFAIFNKAAAGTLLASDVLA
jgi:hypothetical protein